MQGINANMTRPLAKHLLHGDGIIGKLLAMLIREDLGGERRIRKRLAGEAVGFIIDQGKLSPLVLKKTVDNALHEDAMLAKRAALFLILREQNGGHPRMEAHFAMKMTRKL